ncbi:TPA: hypothetical protein IAD52_08625 [Candidatus Spyradomonas excrementavium]|nr:hypothetical protein [Candidatus Spyradomonas excrementavium]
MPTTITKPQQKLSESPKAKILAPYVQMRLNKIFYDELNSHDSIFVKFDKNIIRKIASFISGETKRSCAIGIAGETASGKSTIAMDIIDTINMFTREYCLENTITRINTDDYYYDRSEMVKTAGSFAEFAKNYDLDVPEALELDLMASHIKQLLAGRKVLLPKYDLSGTAKRYDNYTPADPANIIISEGLFTLTEKIAGVFDIKIYVDVSANVQKDRFYKRAAERNLGDSADEVYENASSKAKIHIHPTAETADIILTGEADRERYKQFINRVLCVVEELHHKDLVLF